MNEITRKMCNTLQQNQSETSKQKISRLLSEVNELSEVEKLMFYLNLPTGVQRDIKEVDASHRPEAIEASNWIRTHLQPDQELCLPKQDVYEEYQLYCDKHDIKCVGREDLGKLMKTIYPSVTGRRLGTRGQTKHCYGGLTKQSELSYPTLPVVAAEFENNNIKKEKQVNKTDMVKASSALLCEWAEKLLNQEFHTINDIAEHLVRQSYVNCNSVAAYTIMSQAQKIKEEQKCTNAKENSAMKSTVPVLTRQNSCNQRSAKQQLQLKLQEKERWKEQKKKIEEQRCAITGEHIKQEETTNSGSGDPNNTSHDTSMSSETTSNQGHPNKTDYRQQPVQKILPKPIQLPTTVNSQQSSSTASTSAAKPVLIMSPTPNSGQYAPMILVSPMNTNQQILLPLTATSSGVGISTKQGAVVATSSSDSASPTTALITQLGLTSFSSSPETTNSSQKGTRDEHISDATVKSAGLDFVPIFTANSQNIIFDQNNTLLETKVKYCNGFDVNSQQIQSTVTAIQQTNGNDSAKNLVEATSNGLQRSQSLPAGLVNATTADNVINESDCVVMASVITDSIERNSATTSVSEVNPATKKEEQSTQFVWSLPLQNPGKKVCSEKTSNTIPPQTLDPVVMSKLGLQDSDSNELPVSDGMVSPHESLQLTPTQGGNKGSARKSNSKTVLSLLKEQRVKIDSPELGGKNRYVNDNRPVAQILKELREKKKSFLQQSPAACAMQNLSFKEEKIPKQVNEKSVMMLKEKIAREAVVMRKAHALNFGVKPSGNIQVNSQAESSLILDSASTQARTGRPVQKLAKRNTSKDDKNIGNSGLKGQFKSHQLALRNLLNEKRPETSDVDAMRVKIEEKVAQPTSVISSTKQNLFLKKFLESTLSKNDDVEKSSPHLKNVCAAMNPTLASMLSNNNNGEKIAEKTNDDKLLAGFMQTLDNISDQLNAESANNSNASSIFDEHQFNKSTAVLNNSNPSTWTTLQPGVRYNTSNQQRIISHDETSTEFIPIHGVEEANIVNPIRPQAVGPNDYSGTSNNQGQFTNVTNTANLHAKLKALLSCSPSPSNSTDSFDVNSGADWLPRQNSSSSFVPYNQTFTNQSEQQQQQAANILSSHCVNIDGKVDLSNDSFEQNASIFQNRNIVINTSNSNFGFASMEGVRPPSKRGMDPENFDKQGFLSKRSRHLSDQTNRRPRRNNVFMPPLQPLIQPLVPQNRTPSHESLTPMPSPSSSQGSSYGQYPPESPFSPEVHAIMSSTTNTSDFYSNEFTGTVGSMNNFRSMSVPVQNFMQNDLDYNNYTGTGPVGDANSYGQIGNQIGMPDNNSQYVEMPQSVQGTSSNMGYPQQQQEDMIADNLPYNTARKNLIQILESRLASSAGFRGDPSQNLRGDHMISGASVKPTPNMRHKLGETLNSVMLHNPGSNLGNGGINHQTNFCNSNTQNMGHYNNSTAGVMPNPTPPGSHPPTPVDFTGENIITNQSNQHQQPQQQQYTVMSRNMMGSSSVGSVSLVGGNSGSRCGMNQIIDTQTNLVDNLGSRESRESMVVADPMFSMCDENEVNAADIAGNAQFDFLRIL